MSKVKLKDAMSGNRRNVICDGQRITIFKKIYQSIPNTWEKYFDNNYDMITDGEPVIQKNDEVKKEIKELEDEVKEIKKKVPKKKKFTLKTK